MKIIKEVSHVCKLAVTPAFQQPAKGAIWFFHGACDSGPGLQTWVHETVHRKFNFHHHKILYPSAPFVPCDLFGGKAVSVWFNRLKLTPDFPEDISSVDRSTTSIGNLIKEQAEADGIPMSKVVLGGFSEGGTLALHLAYRLHTQVAGCFVLSSFLPPDSQVFRSLAKKMNQDNIMRKKAEAASTAASGPRATQESQSHHSPQKHSEIPIPRTRTGTGVATDGGAEAGTEKSPRSAANGKFYFPELTESPDFPSISKSSGISSSKTIKRSLSSSSSSLANNVGSANSNSTMGIESGVVKLPELFMSHGSKDPLVYYPWAKSTFRHLKSHGVPGYFYTLPHLEHGIHPAQLHLLHNWIDGVLRDPPKKNPPHSDDKNRKNHYSDGDGGSSSSDGPGGQGGGGVERPIYFWPQ